MNRNHRHLNRFGFAEDTDMTALAQTTDLADIERTLHAVIPTVLDDERFMDSLSDRAQADLRVPLSMAATHPST